MAMQRRTRSFVALLQGDLIGLCRCLDASTVTLVPITFKAGSYSAGVTTNGWAFMVAFKLMAGLSLRKR